jgi:signal transduction histidine kinase
MKPFSYRNRIAFNYIVATAALLALVFFLVFFVVRVAVYSHLDNLLDKVAEKHSKEVLVQDGKIKFINKDEWEEREHREVEVNPVFIEVYGLDGKLMDRSPNLKADELGFDVNSPENKQFNARLHEKHIRKIKVGVVRNGEKVGFVSAAVPIEGYLLVLSTLHNILLVSFPFSLLLLFLVARYLAGKSIRPVRVIIEATQKIQQDSLNDRIPVPGNVDELHQLASAINELLERIEGSMIREKQFTSDAAHQLKTPLAVMKGTFEVLVRKPRDNQEYVARINAGIDEIDRMSEMVDQLLLLARVDGKQYSPQHTDTSLVEIIDTIIQRFSRKISEQNLSIVFNPDTNFSAISDPFLLELIFENLISNALKYSNPGGKVEIRLKQSDDHTFVEISDNGKGIRKDDMEHVFSPFYRSGALEQTNVKGYGLGLSIVKRACSLAGIKMELKSIYEKGTDVVVMIPIKN